MAATTPPSKRRNGRHRKGRRGTQAYTQWVGAGAVAIGLGAAMATGQGVALADESAPEGSTGAASKSASTAGTTDTNAAPATFKAGSGAPSHTSGDAPTSTVSARTKVSDGTSEVVGEQDDSSGRSQIGQSSSPSQSTQQVGDGVTISSSGGAVDPGDDTTEQAEDEVDVTSTPTTEAATPTPQTAEPETGGTSGAKDSTPGTNAHKSATTTNGTPSTGDSDDREPTAATLFASEVPESASTSTINGADTVLSASVVETHAVMAAPATPAVPANIVVGLVSGLLGWVGLSPSATTTPVAPTQSLLLAAALTLGRREQQQALAAQSPTTGNAAVQTSQSVTGLITGLLGGLLHALFNSPPTTNYDPAKNTQSPTGVVTGTLNAVDPDGDPLSFTVTQAPAHGTVLVNGPNGSFTYTPDPAFAHTGGTDTFTVRLSDNHPSLFSPAGVITRTVSVTVKPVNAPPAAGSPAYTITNVNPSSGVVTGKVNVTDPDGDALTYSLRTPPNEGTVDVDPVTGVWTYTPTLKSRLEATDINVVPDEHQVSFTIAAADSTDSITVDVTAPVAPLAITTIDVDRYPMFPVIRPDNSVVYVANAFGRYVSVIDTATNTVINTVWIGNTLTSATISPDGSWLYVLDRDQHAVWRIRTADHQVIGGYSVQSARYVAANPNGQTLYVVTADDTVAVVDIATNTVTDTVPVGDIGEFGEAVVAFNPDGTRAYVSNVYDGTVSVIDTATNTVVDTVAVGARLPDELEDEGPGGIVVSPDGTRVYVVEQQFVDGKLWVLDAATNTVIDADPTTPEVDAIALGRRPAIVAVSPDGDYLFATNVGDLGNDTVSVIDTATNTVIATIGVGENPLGVTVSPDGSRVYVANRLSDSVSVIALT